MNNTLNHPHVVFEAVPPSYKHKEISYNKLRQLLSEYNNYIDAIGIPEISDEELNRKDTKRVPQFEFADWLNEIYSGPFTFYRPVVYYSRDENEVWMENVKKRGCDQVVIVGAHSSSIKPLTTLEEGVNLAKNYGFNVSGILIPSRVNELERVQRKMEWGIETFYSQVLYESVDMLKLLNSLLEIKQVLPKFPLIYITIAPISVQSHIDFLKGIRAYIPEDLENILRDSHDISMLSFMKAMKIYSTIAEYSTFFNIGEKIGTQVAYMRLPNMKLAFDLAKEIKTMTTESI